MKYQKPQNKLTNAMTLFKHNFCSMWKREFGNLPTEWIIKDYLKSLSKKHSTTASKEPAKDVSEFTIEYIDDYLPKRD